MALNLTGTGQSATFCTHSRLALQHASMIPALAQTAAGSTALGVFYVSLLFIFLTAIVTAVVTKWARDKCLKFFHGYHLTLERAHGQTIWGQFRASSSGVEVVYDHAYADVRGRKKTSYLIYGPELETHMLSLLRYHDELDAQQQQARRAQIRRTFNPGPIHRLWRSLRNFVNTLRDAFNTAIGAAIGQYQRMNPASAVLASQAGSMTSLGQTLLARFAGNAYEPLLEQYIGQPVILDVADPLNPDNSTVEYTGYLADYTQQFVALFNVDHTTEQEIELTLPDLDEEALAAALPPAGTPPVLSAPIKTEHGIEIRIDHLRLKLLNTTHRPLAVRRLERTGFQPISFGMVIPSMGTLDLPARDARGGKLMIEVVSCVDVLAPRKYATIRHAGELVDRRGFANELHLDQLPLVPALLNESTRSAS
jgi:hypothetical protein